MKQITSILLLVLSAGCAFAQVNQVEDSGRSVAAPVTAAAGATALLSANATTLNGPPPVTDIDFDWAVVAYHGWVCLGAHSGKFYDDALCAFKPRVDRRWSEFAAPGVRFGR